MSNMGSDPSLSEGAFAPQLSEELPSPKQKSLMENILADKMERMATNSKIFVRTNSADSTGSMSSVTSISSNICKCDDCLLGIGDSYGENPEGKSPNARKVLHDANDPRVQGARALPALSSAAYSGVLNATARCRGSG
ncbi:hypothetical protein Trydic_g20894 [Trypoxylus dichotomus]